VIIAIGIDTVHIPRFTAMLDRRPRLIERLFTTAESHRDSGEQRSASSLAARFAAKEAVAKALGAPAGLAWHDCQILSEEGGRPRIHVRGTVLAAAAGIGIERWHLSLTHDGDYAAAQIVAEGPDRSADQAMGQDRTP
jgi:holo-[acyl-carrier protein] synthase